MRNNPIQLFLAPRCGAKTRRGPPCQSPAANGRKRCRMHGGAARSGAPRGNKNALKHGWYTAESLLHRGRARQLLRSVRSLLDLAHGDAD